MLHLIEEIRFWGIYCNTHPHTTHDRDAVQYAKRVTWFWNSLLLLTLKKVAQQLQATGTQVKVMNDDTIPPPQFFRSRGRVLGGAAGRPSWPLHALMTHPNGAQSATSAVRPLTHQKPGTTYPTALRLQYNGHSNYLERELQTISSQLVFLTSCTVV